MTSNGNGNHANNGDVEANEQTGLLDGSSPSGTATSQESNASEQLWEEMDQPWPATFERTMSLLASPVIGAAEVDEFTKSPKPGNTPLANRRRMVRFFILKDLKFHVLDLLTNTLVCILISISVVWKLPKGLCCHR